LGKSVCFNAGQLVFEFIYFFNKKIKTCHVGQEPDTSRTLDARIALLGDIS
jgi:hypothetical protein